MAEYQIKNYNQNIRNQINKVIEKNLLKGISVAESINQIINQLYDLEEIQNPPKQAYREYFMGVTYIDAYKMLAYKQKKNMMTEQEKDFFFQIYNISNLIDLTTEISANPEFFSNIVKLSYDFSLLPNLAKSLVIMSLYPSENHKLATIFPGHSLDLAEYSQIITINTLVDEIQKQINYYEKVLCIDFTEGIVLSICGFIKDFFAINPHNSTVLCLNLAQKDYQASKYLIDKVDDKQTLQQHISTYENLSLTDIIIKLKDDDEFLFDTIWMLIDLCVLKSYNTLKIDESLVSSYGEQNIVKKLTPPPSTYPE